MVSLIQPDRPLPNCMTILFSRARCVGKGLTPSLLPEARLIVLILVHMQPIYEDGCLYSALSIPGFLRVRLFEKLSCLGTSMRRPSGFSCLFRGRALPSWWRANPKAVKSVMAWLIHHSWCYSEAGAASTEASNWIHERPCMLLDYTMILGGGFPYVAGERILFVPRGKWKQL